jgi:hypothetical protein
MVKVVELRRVRVSQASSSPETRDRKGGTYVGMYVSTVKDDCEELRGMPILQYDNMI